MLEAVIAHQAQVASVAVVQPAPAHVSQTPPWYRPLTAQCVIEEANRQRLNPWKVATVLKVEGGRVGMFSQNKNGSYDIGPMQVNSVHLPDLSKLYGLPQHTIAQLLAYDGCFNVAVAAWLLRKRTNEAGGDFWRGIGRYHSKNAPAAQRYIRRAEAALQELQESAARASAATQTRLYTVSHVSGSTQ